ncbi:MAG: hypothetical protein ACRDN9_14175 [Streptosporangiaceae bacterium]
MIFGDRLRDEWWPVAKRGDKRGPLRPATRALYERVIDDKIRTHSLGRTPLQAITPQQLEKFYGDLAEGRHGQPLAEASVQVVHSVCHNALAKAVDWGPLNHSPAERVSPPTPDAHEVRTWTDTQDRLVFCQPSGEVLSPDSVSGIFRRAVKRLDRRHCPYTASGTAGPPAR